MLVSKATLSACLVASVLVSPAVATAGKLAELRERTGAEPSADDDDDDNAASSHRSSQGSNGSYETYTRRAQHEPSRTSAYFFLEYPYANWDRGILVRKRLPADAILAACVPEDPECVTREHVAACIDGYCYGSPRTASWGGSRLQSTRPPVLRSEVDAGTLGRALF